MIIALFPNKTKKNSLKLAKEIAEFFSKNKVTAASEDDIAAEINCRPLSSIKKADIKFLISIGGDGTILGLSHKYSDLNAPLIGINTGEIGFMADIPLKELYPCLEDILQNKFAIENRLMIEASYKSSTFFAANEVLIHRAANHRLIKISVDFGKSHLSTFAADGIIVATPNGSTAYSLAAGGPILYPQLEALVLTPICPHTISVRPIVLTANEEIKVQYLSKNEKPIDLIIDGIDVCPIQTNDVITIRKSKKTFKVVKLFRHNYFSTLNSKLGWSGQLP